MGFDGADRSISKFSVVSGTSALPPSGKNTSKKLSKENKGSLLVQNLHSIMTATENKSGIDFTSPLP